MKETPPLTANWPELTGWRYSSGGLHAAFDLACPIGTPVYAVRDGMILDCNDGVPNDKPWSPDYTNEPSNWILLGIRYRDRPGPYSSATAYYQHLSPGLKVRRGQEVNAGQLIAHSGDSGNTGDPHLHFAASWGYQTDATRYSYMNNDGNNDIVIYPPDRLWKAEDDDMALSAEGKQDVRQIVEGAIRREVWRHQLPVPGGGDSESFHKAATRWQRRTVAVAAAASAEATMEALAEAKIVKREEVAAISKRVGDAVAARVLEILADDDTVAPPDAPAP